MIPTQHLISIRGFFESNKAFFFINPTRADTIPTSEADVAALQWGYKKSREIARRMGLSRGEFVPGHPAFSNESAAACGPAIGPVSISSSNIKYTPEDEDALEKYNRNFGGSVCSLIFGEAD